MLRSRRPRPTAHDEPLRRSGARRTGLLIAAGGALLLAAIAAVAIGLSGGSRSHVEFAPNSVAVIDARSDNVVGAVGVGARPGGIAFGSGSVWVANADDQTVSRIDPTTPANGADASGGRHADGYRGEPRGDMGRGIGPGRQLGGGHAHRPRVQLARTRGADRERRPGRAGSDRRARQRGLGRPVVRAADASRRGHGAGGSPRLTRTRAQPPWTSATAPSGSPTIRPTTSRALTRPGSLTQIPVGNGPTGIAVGAGGVWVADSLDNKITRIDPGSRSVTDTIPVGRSPSGVAVGAGSVWVANSGDGTVTRIDPLTNRVLATIPVGGSPQAITVADGRVWVTLDAQTIKLAAGGGTLRWEIGFDFDSLDPAVSYFRPSWQVLYATCAQLLNYPDASGPAGETADTGGRAVAAGRLGGSQDLPIHDPQRLSLLAAIESGGHRTDVQGRRSSAR